jgi:hypothetical protein
MFKFIVMWCKIVPYSIFYGCALIGEKLPGPSSTTAKNHVGGDVNVNVPFRILVPVVGNRTRSISILLIAGVKMGSSVYCRI